MIITGIACTPHMQNHILLSGAVDITRAATIPLFIEHKYRVGDVVRLDYVANDLFCTAETDDEAALKLGFLSIAGKPLRREARADGRWLVHEFLCAEISVVARPANSKCVVLERKPSDPFRALAKTRQRELDLFADAFRKLANGLQSIANLT